MPMIDADTHVDECEDTWKKLEGTPYAKYIPVTVSMPPDEAKRAGYNATTSRCWVVEGRLQNRAIRDEVNHPPRLLRELQDVPGRVAHMDKMGVDVQVIFPTFFIRYNTSNAEAEWALTTTYNRWLAEKCAHDKRKAALGGCVAAASIPTRPSKNCVGRKSTAPAVFSSAASTSTGRSPTRTFFRFTRKPARSTCLCASTPAIRCRATNGTGASRSCTPSPSW